MKNILVIGGTGFIGSNLTIRLSLLGHNVFIFARPDKEKIKDKENTNIIFGSIDDLDLLKSILKDKNINTVVHLASNMIPSSGLKFFENELDDIVKPTLALIPSLAALNIKLVYFSSGGTIYGKCNEELCCEFDAPAPISYYGLSKLFIEEAIKNESRRSGLSYIILRPSNPYGIGQDIYKNQGLIAACLHKTLTNQPITIWGDGSVVRDYIYIDDLTDIVIQLMDKAQDNQVYNIGSGVGYSVNEILQFIKEVSGNHPVIIFEPSRSVDLPHMVLDVSKANEFCNLKLKSIRQGIEYFYLELQKLGY